MFVQTAFVLENTGVRAYLGQAARIKSSAILKAAATISTVEARHAAAVAVLLRSALRGRQVGHAVRCPDAAHRGGRVRAAAQSS